MAEKHPYIQGPGNFVPIIMHFRKSFPTTVTAETLQKLGFAPKNETYVLNVLRFLGLLDQDGKKTEAASKVFNLHDDGAFSQEFSKIVERAYHALFELHGDKSWNLDIDSLMTFFRSSDQTTAIVGKRQAITFQILAAFSGHGEVPIAKAGSVKAISSLKKKTEKNMGQETGAKKNSGKRNNVPEKGTKNFGLTVRIEINLPADGDQETYDRIFKSIKENLLNE